MISDRELKGLYLDLLKMTLTGMIAESPPLPVPWMGPGVPYSPQLRAQGSDWPSVGHTMIGLHRLQHLQECTESVLAEGIPGDLMECGIWRGGACILMRAVLKAHGVKDRTVWAADSFQGLLRHAEGHDALAVSEEQVRHNFSLYGMLDDQVRFIPGWFHESLPEAPVEALALLRLDGDQYAAQYAVLEAMYPRLSPRGYVIIDDYPGIPETAQAVSDYRSRNMITTEIRQAGAAGWWRKERAS